MIGHSGIHIVSNGEAWIKSCKIEETKHHGIYVNRSGKAVVEDCEIINADGCGIFKENDAFSCETKNVTMKDCKNENVGQTTSSADCLIM